MPPNKHIQKAMELRAQLDTLLDELVTDPHGHRFNGFLSRARSKWLALVAELQTANDNRTWRNRIGGDDEE